MKVSKRSLTLLEVLIAFALIVLCVLPLISPHVLIYRSQNAFSEKIELDQRISQLYAFMVEKLYRNEIPFEELTSEKEHPIPETLMKNLSYKGSYRFRVDRHKENREGSSAIYLVDLIFNFVSPKGEKKEFIYKIVIKKASIED